MFNVEYPEDAALFNTLITKQINACPDSSGNNQDLDVESSGHLTISCSNDSNTISMKGDIVCNSNMIINGTTYMQDANVYRVFNDDYTISYGFQINDVGKLVLYKHDSRINKSTVVSTFGFGDISTNSSDASETSTSKIDNLLSKKEQNINIYGKSLSRRQNS